MKANPEPRRIRRIFKWAGISTCILIVTSWIASVFWTVGYMSDRWIAGLGDGFVALGYFGGSTGYVEGWIGGKASGGVGFIWPRIERFAGGGPAVTIPFWMLLLMMGCLTAFVFWSDRRRIPPGHCQRCGYNLTGNVSSVCSECGEEIATS